VHVLLDENLPLDLAAEIPGHDVQTVRSRGWTGIENGELMRLAAGVCEAFVTMDQNLPRQQDVPSLPFGVIIMHAPSNRLVHLRPLVGALLHAIESVNPGELQRVGV
jgi:hypothetical protein